MLGLNVNIRRSIHFERTTNTTLSPSSDRVFITTERQDTEQSKPKVFKRVNKRRSILTSAKNSVTNGQTVMMTD